MYDFDCQNTKQKEYFKAFEHWLKNRSTVTRVEHPTEREDRAGVDLWLYCPDRKSMQVKTDFAAHRTGNMAYEIVSQAYADKPCKLGWGLEIYSIDYLAYIIAETGDLYIWRGAELQGFVIKNYSQFPTFPAENKGYFTLGVLVELSKISHLCVAEANIFDLNGA